MDAGDIYRRLPGLTEGEALALAYHLGEADAERAAGAVSGVVPTWDLSGAGRDAGRGRAARAVKNAARDARCGGARAAGRVVRGGLG